MKFIIGGILAWLTFGVLSAEPVTIKDLYKKFNMRSIYSSYGQRLQSDCGSYPKDFFAFENAKFSDEHLELIADDDVWMFTITAPNVIKLSNHILSGTYHTVSTYPLYFDGNAQDWKAKETYINKSKECVSCQ